MHHSFVQDEWKPKEPAGNGTQASLPGSIGVVRDPQKLDLELIAKVSFNGALVEAARHSGMEDQELAGELHISPGYMSKFMRGVAQAWAKRLVRYMRVTNSLVPLQWMAFEMGCVVERRSEICRFVERRAA